MILLILEMKNLYFAKESVIPHLAVNEAIVNASWRNNIDQSYYA